MSFSKQQVDDQFADAEDSSIEEVFTLSPKKAKERNETVARNRKQGKPPLAAAALSPSKMPSVVGFPANKARLPSAKKKPITKRALPSALKASPKSAAKPSAKSAAKPSAKATKATAKSAAKPAAKHMLKSATAKTAAKKGPKKRLLKHVKVQNTIKQAKQGHINCIPTWHVHSAARIVAQTLRLWPEASPGVHLQAAVTVENFAKQIFLPYIVAEAGGERIEDGDRVFYATLMALREVLAQNADAIFQIHTPSSDNDDDEGGEKKEPIPESDNQEEKDYARLLMATMVVVTACESAGKDPERVLELIREQDAAFPADRAHDIWKPKAPDGKVKYHEEALAWKVGYNMAHRDRAQRQENYRAALPKPTACWMAVVEQIPAALKKGNLNDV